MPQAFQRKPTRLTGECRKYVLADRHIGTMTDHQPNADPGTALPMEHERRWLLSALPPRVVTATPAVLHQGYLPGETLIERVRSVTREGTTTWVRTVKLGRGVSRIEVEEPASIELGTAMFALTSGKRVEKRRYAIADGDLLWEIDDFTDRVLVLAEVELREADATVVIPAWLAPHVVREITDDPAFTNWALAR